MPMVMLKTIRFMRCITVLEELLREQRACAEDDEMYVENGDAVIQDTIFILKKRIEAEPKAV